MRAQPPTGAPSRPTDVDTGFWLWLAALSLLLIGQIVDVVTTATATDAAKAVGSKYLGLLGIVFILAVGAVVDTAVALWLMLASLEVSLEEEDNRDKEMILVLQL